MLGEMVGRLGYQYDRAGIEAAIKDQERFDDSTRESAKGSEELGKSAERGAVGISNLGDKSKQATMHVGKLDVSLAKVGATVGIIGGLAAAALGGAVAKSADFEQGMQNVAAISASAREHLGELTAQAKELGASTVFNARQAADGMSFLAMAGFDAQEMMGAMPGLLSLAAAGGIELAQAADIASNVLSGFGMEATQAGQVADVLAFTSANANVNIGMMGESMKMVAPVAAAMGVSIDSISAATGKLGDAGIQGTMAGTNLRGILLSLAAPTGEAASALQKLGVEVFDSSGQMKDMSGLVAEFEAGLDGLTDQQKAENLRAIFGKQNIGAFLALLDVGSESLAEFTMQIGASGGAAKLMADTQLDSLQGSIEMMSGAFDGASMKIGDMFLPAVRNGVDVITKLIDGFNQAPGPLQVVVAVLLAGTAVLGTLAAAGIAAAIALGPLVAAYGGVGAAATAAAAASKSFVLAAGPIALGLMAIVGAFAAARKATMEWNESIRSGSEEAIQAGGSLNDFVTSMARAEQEATGWAKAGAVLTKQYALHNTELINATDSYLKYGLGVSDAVMQTKTFKDGMSELTALLAKGKIEPEEYERRLVKLADAASVAAGEGRILTQEQHQQAAAIKESLAAYAQQELGFSAAAVASTEFQEKLQAAAELQAQGKVTAESAAESLRKWSEWAMRAGEVTDDAVVPGVVRAQMAYKDFSATFSGELAGLMHAGEGFLLNEEERATRLDEITTGTKDSIASSLEEMWQKRQEFDGLFQEAAAKDAASRASAQAEVQSGQAAHNKKLADLQAKLAGADGTNAAAIQQSIAEEEGRWNQIVSLAQGGTGAAVAEVQARYDAEREAIRESLAQTVVDHTLSMVMMGEVSAETAQAIFGALSTAYPGVEVISPVEQASVQVFDSLNKVFSGEMDASGLVDTINEAESSLVAFDEQNRESLGIQQQTFEGMAIAAAAGGDVIITASNESAIAVEESALRMSDAELQATGVIGTELATRRSEYEDTSAAASTHADDVTSAGQKAAGGMQAAEREMSASQAAQREELAKTGTKALGVASDVTRGWTAVPSVIGRSGAEAAASLEDMNTGVQGTARSLEELQAAADSAGSGQAAALEGGIKAAKDAASQMGDTAESVVDLGGAVEELPDEIVFDGADATKLLRELDRMLDDLRANAQQGFVIRGRYEGKDPPSRAMSPFALMGMIDDVRESASEGFTLAGHFADRSGGLLGATREGREFPLERMLRRLAESDYEVVIRARLEAGDLIAGIGAAVDDARALFDALMRGHAAFFSGGAADEGSLAAFLSSGGDLALDDSTTQIRDQLIGFLESLPSMAHLLANPDDRAEIEAMIEEQMRLWGRFIEDLEAAEDARHAQWVANIEDEKERGEEAADEALDRINRLLEIRRSGTGPAGDKPIELEDFSDEVDRVARLFADLGVIANGTKSDLEAFYSEMTGGVNTSINSSEALIDVIELMKEAWAEGTDDQMEAENARHEAAKANIEGQDELIQRLLEDWELGIERVGDAEAALAAARKAFLDELKAERKAADDLEKAVHDELMDRLDELEEREEEAHEARLARLDEREEAEVARAEAEIAREREHLDSLEAGLRELERQKVDRELAEIGDGISIGLAEAESALDGLNKALSEFDKRAEIRERARRRPGSRGMGKVALDENARAGLQAALDSGELSDTAARRARLALSGVSLGVEQMRQLYEEAGLSLNDTLDARRDEIALLDEQIARQQLLIDQETFRFEDAEEAINANHQARMDAIQAERDAEEAAWEAFQDRVEEAREAEDDRHEEKMRQIEREFRARLLAEGFIDEAGRDPDEIAREIAELADRLFRPIKDYVNETRGSKATPIGSGIGGAPPIGIAPPVAPGAPPPVPPPIVPPGILPTLSPGAEEAFLGALITTDSAAGGFILPPGAEAAVQAVTHSVQTFVYNQHAPNQVFDAADAPDEFLQALYGLVGLRRAP